MTRRILSATATWIAMAAIVCLLVSGCTSGQRQEPKPATSSQPGFPISLTDSFGRKVDIPAKPARVISLAPSNTEILFELGIGSQVVGVTRFCDYPAQARQIENVGGYSNPSVEKIVSLKPDLVLAAEAHKSVVEQLEKLKIPVVTISAKRVADIPEAIVLVGQATGTSVKAKEVQSSLNKRIDTISSKTKSIAEKDRPRVFYELWHEPITTIGPGSYLNDLISLAGGTSITADAKSAYPVVSAETVISRNPQIIMYAHGKQRVEQVQSRPGWANVSAVKSARIVLFQDENVFMRAGPRIAEALEILAKSIHPEMFK